MYLRDLPAGLVRRWYLVLVGVALTVGGVLGVLQVVTVSYEAKASIVLLPPKTSVLIGGNPYLYLGGLGQAVDVVVRAVNADPTREAFIGSHPGVDYLVGPDPTTTGPIMAIDVTGPTAASSLGGLRDILTTVPATLNGLQDRLSVSAGSRISLMDVAVDEKATVVSKTRTRVMLAMGAIGLALTVLLTGVVDGFLLRRKRRTVVSVVPPGPRPVLTPAAFDSTDLVVPVNPDGSTSGSPPTPAESPATPTGAPPMPALSPPTSVASDDRQSASTSERLGQPLPGSPATPTPDRQRPMDRRRRPIRLRAQGTADNLTPDTDAPGGSQRQAVASPGRVREEISISSARRT